MKLYFYNDWKILFTERFRGIYVISLINFNMCYIKKNYFDIKFGILGFHILINFNLEK